MADSFLGEIKIISWNFPAKGWAFCNGQLLAINQNQALFSVLGTMYGGDGRVNFALPNLQGRAALHFGNGFSQGQAAGEQAHTLSAGEMPMHNHTWSAISNGPNSPSPVSNLLGGLNAYNGSANTSMAPAQLGAVGASQPHDNMQPYLVLNFCIALQGIFPSQN